MLSEGVNRQGGLWRDAAARAFAPCVAAHSGGEPGRYPWRIPMSSPSSRWSKRSLAAQALGHVDPVTKAVVMPIHVATTYIRDEDNAYSSGYVYGRPDNAT